MIRKKTNRILRFILKYSFTKNLHKINLTDIDNIYKKHPEVFHQQDATHIVTGILYGRDIFFIFDRTLSNDVDRINIENDIKLLLHKFDKFKILSSGELNWNDHEKQLARTLTCQYYGDFQYESSPTTFEEAFKFYIYLLNFVLEKNDCEIPKEAWIYPIYLLNPSSGSMKEIDLTNLLNNCDLSLTNKRSIDEWIQLKTKEINELYNFQKDLEKQSHICLLTCSFVEVQKQFTSKFILRLIFHLTEKSDSPSMKIFQCFDDKVKNSTNQYTKTGSWFNENNIKTIKKQILSFIRFVELNSSKTNIKFIVNEEYADEFQMKKGVTCILYQNGIPIDFEIPSEPGQPYATNVSDHSLTLCWSKPIDGSQSIQHYKVYRNNCLDKAWKLLLTTDDTILSVNISDLSNGRYQFKIQGVTLVGDTLESDASDEI
ncbi:unnamed protein product, partial [Rotaria sp. Silwood1]